MHARILEGLRNGEFHVVYQPQMSADGQRIASVEALVRWSAPSGPVPLPQFLSAAETTGAIRQIGAFVLRQACTDALAWPGIRVAVNISAVQLRTAAFAQSVETIVRETGLPFEQLELEIVESAVIDDFDQAAQTLSYLRSLGITIALDDFGTGFSSLTYLRKLPLDKLKIDKSFVDDVEKAQGAAVVHAVVALGRALGFKITAEGVETEAQHRFLRACGCHFMQGYYFSRPVIAGIITRRLAEIKAA